MELSGHAFHMVFYYYLNALFNGDSKYFEFTTKFPFMGGGGRKPKREEIYVNILLICFTVQQKLAHYKAIILHKKRIYILEESKPEQSNTIL